MFSKLIAIGILSIGLGAFAPKAQAVTANEAYEIGMEGYTYLYPLITMEITRKVQTNSPLNEKNGRAPMGTISNVRAFPAPDFRDVVRPNFDTLYSMAWIDVSKEPMILSVGDTKGRYYLLPLLDMWTNVFAVPGKRTSGTDAHNFAIVYQGWNGTLPEGVEKIIAPTSTVWMIGRTQTNGVADYSFVHKIQDTYSLTRLSDWGRESPKPGDFKPDPTIDMITPPLLQVNNMSAAKFFALGAELMDANPPQVTDWSTITRLKRIGFVAGSSFDLSLQPKEIQDAVAKGAKDALTYMAQKAPTIARVVNGWQMNTDTMGVYGNYYLKRAIVAELGLGANLPEDAIYPLALADANGQALTGDHDYILHFAKESLPPANAFWSLTMYDAQGFMVDNELHRFAIGDRDALKYNSDGSLDLYIQHRNPGPALESNWLPSPGEGQLGMAMRLYSPKRTALDGTWNPPAIQRR